MVMEGAGFEVINLGIINPAENYLAALAESEPDMLGMSALLTTTMPYMAPSRRRLPAHFPEATPQP